MKTISLTDQFRIATQGIETVSELCRRYEIGKLSSIDAAKFLLTDKGKPSFGPGSWGYEMAIYSETERRSYETIRDRHEQALFE